MRSASLTLGETTYTLRDAAEEDVGAIAILLDGEVAEQDLTPYVVAFRGIDVDPAHLLLVAEDMAGRIAATLHLVLAPGIARRATVRALVDAVRVGAAPHRGILESTLLRWAVDEARARGAGDVLEVSG
jgi:hypothetical protein